MKFKQKRRPPLNEKEVAMTVRNLNMLSKQSGPGQATIYQSRRRTSFMSADPRLIEDIPVANLGQANLEIAAARFYEIPAEAIDQLRIRGGQGEIH
jgi:hypothetical protein